MVSSAVQVDVTSYAHLANGSIGGDGAWSSRRCRDVNGLQSKGITVIESRALLIAAAPQKASSANSVER